MRRIKVNEREKLKKYLDKAYKKALFNSLQKGNKRFIFYEGFNEGIKYTKKILDEEE
jgi:hypothetical protein